MGIRNEIKGMMHEYTGIIHKNEWIIANLEGWLKKPKKNLKKILLLHEL